MASMDQELKDVYAALAQKDWVDVEAKSRHILRGRPTAAPALHAMGCVHSDRGDDSEALRLYREAIHFDPKFLAPYYPLARTYYIMGRLEEAAQLYQEWSLVDPENPEVQHMTAAMTGRGPPLKCSEAYIQVHFNQFAQRFDDVLVKHLAYKGPEMVAEALAKYALTIGPALDVLDAGCGTGLCGPLVRSRSRTLIGVDLAERMIEHARKRRCYDDLVVSELVAFLESQSEAFDAIVSADVLIYFGALENFAEAARYALRPGGLLVVTLEALNDAGTDPYQLQANGRYSHREAYVQSVMGTAGFEILSIQQDFLRWECGKKVAAHCAVARKP